MSIAIVIPARRASQRLPDKMLLNATGKPLIQHTYEQACQSKLASRVLIATDDAAIEAAAKSFGAEVVMTSPDHPTGSDRISEVAEKFLPNVDCIVNVQGDEPEIHPQYIDHLIALFLASGSAMATLVVPFHKNATEGTGSPHDPNCVKAVLGNTIKNSNGSVLGNEALYFSRSLIPYPRDNKGVISDPSQYYLHLGIYAYTPDFVKHYVKLPQGKLENIEKLEQLRILENGYRIVAGIVPEATPGIDTQEDYDRFVQRFKERAHHDVCTTS
jgi:3-deoxy-manno-octulosonate cytidylyltransferase (CMP-KDO synthetase)